MCRVDDGPIIILFHINVYLIESRSFVDILFVFISLDIQLFMILVRRE